MLEVCVDTIAGVHAAKAGGAARVELCAALSEGGLTPSFGLMQSAAECDIPCYAMIRPRAGLFHFSPDEIDIMFHDIRAARGAGLAGVVLGAQNAAGDLDQRLLARLIVAAQLPATLHRVIDVVPDPLVAVEQAAELGFERILSSGGAATAWDGRAVLADMVRIASGRLSVMPGGGVNVTNAAQLMAQTGATELHASCAAPAKGDPAFANFDPPDGRRVTDTQIVDGLVAAMTR